MATKSKLKSPALQKRLKKIKLLILDVDGVLTDARIFWQEGYGWTRFYNVRDGYGITQLLKNGLQVAIISAGSSKDVQVRMEYLGIKDIYLGSEDKTGAYQKILADKNLKPEQVAYIADEFFDLPILRDVGFSATVADAPVEVKKAVHFVTEGFGGFGAVREVIDGLMEAQKIKKAHV